MVINFSQCTDKFVHSKYNEKCLLEIKYFHSFTRFLSSATLETTLTNKEAASEFRVRV